MDRPLNEPPAQPPGPPQPGGLPDDAPLPPLRADLQLVEGPEQQDGQRVWKIHDPLAQRYFEIGQDAVDLLAVWNGGTVGALAARVALRGDGTEDPKQTVMQLMQFLDTHELLAPRPQQSFSRAKAAGLKKTSLITVALHTYLSIRVPLARPDRLLRRTLPYMAWAFQPAFWCVVLAGAVLGLYLVSHQWEDFLNTFTGMLDLGGIATYGACLIFVKALHELGHGYTAVRMGSRVTTMGVTFLVMAPVAYTDTTDAWRLANRADRVRIDIAGMAVEVIIAVIATLAWVFIPDGALRSVAFALATTGWVMSVAVNCNPLMRFDGYYLLSDLVGVPNLQDRSFAMAKWRMRELLFAYGEPIPEETTRALRLGLIAYAWTVWIYRFFLFLGIAVLVYHYFFKILGIFLFGVEMWWFILRPIWRELAVWISRRGQGGRRARWTVGIAAAALVALCMPWPYTLRIPAVLSASGQAPAYAPRPARIEEVLVHPGQQVKAGDVLLRLSAPALDEQLDRSRETARGVAEHMARSAADARDLSESLVLERQLRMEQDRGDGVQRERERLVVRAAVSGTVVDVADELHPGRWVDDRTRLVLIARPGTLQATGYVDGTELSRIEEGLTGRFVDEERLMRPVDVRLDRIAAAASESIDEPLLTSAAGGTLPVRPDRESHSNAHALRPEYAAFEVFATAAAPLAGTAPVTAPLTEVRGELQVRGHAQSLVLRALRRVAQILVREAVL